MTQDIITSQTQDFDHDRYQSHLELLLKSAQEEYKIVTVDMRTHQTNYLKNYIWISSLLIGFEFTASLYLYENFYKGYSILLFTVPILISLISFLISVDAMRGRNLTFSMYDDNYDYLAEEIHKECSGEYGKYTLLISMLQRINKSIDYNRGTRDALGKKLRMISILLVSSAVALALATPLYFHVGSCSYP